MVPDVEEALVPEPRLAPVLDLTPRLRARQAPPRRRRVDVLLDVAFGAGLAWSMWRSLYRKDRA